jgi:membrane-associated protein
MVDMQILKYLIDFVLHIDKNLTLVIQDFGTWSYGILWFVIFMETGFVVTPFLPGDSLLFAAGALSASTGAFNIWWLWGLVATAAFLGDTVNYWIGYFIGPRAFSMKSGILKKAYLDKAQTFYDKHGGKAIVLARFVPIVRTFAPFVAGIGKMHYGRFISYNAVGGLAWVTLFTMGGYFFGNIPIVKHNFEIVVVLIVLISVVPIGIEWWKTKRVK